LFVVVFVVAFVVLFVVVASITTPWPPTTPSTNPSLRPVGEMLLNTGSPLQSASAAALLVRVLIRVGNRVPLVLLDKAVASLSLATWTVPVVVTEYGTLESADRRPAAYC